MDKVIAMHDPDNVVPVDEAGYIYHVVSPHGKRDVRMDRDDPEAYSVFIESVKKGEVFVDDNGVVPLTKEGFSRGRSEGALPQAASGTDLMAPPAFIRGDKRPKPGPLATPLRRGRSRGLVETEKLPTPPPTPEPKRRSLQIRRCNRQKNWPREPRLRLRRKRRPDIASR